MAGKGNGAINLKHDRANPHARTGACAEEDWVRQRRIARRRRDFERGINRETYGRTQMVLNGRLPARFHEQLVISRRKRKLRQVKRPSAGGKHLKLREILPILSNVA